MSKIGPEGRSFLSLELPDLRRLLAIARLDRETFFRDHRDWSKAFANRVFCVALCQGGAKHCVDHTTGNNDFDVYTFYEKNPRRRWYAKRLKSYDFGSPKFGQSVDRPDFKGRRVDCLSRDIEVRKDEDCASALRRYLQEGKTRTAKLFAKKAVVLLEPDCGFVVWPFEIRPTPAS